MSIMNGVKIFMTDGNTIESFQGADNTKGGSNKSIVIGTLGGAIHIVRTLIDGIFYKEKIIDNTGTNDNYTKSPKNKDDDVCGPFSGDI